MKELKAPDKVTQKMTHDGAVTENLATGEVTNISSRDPEVDLSASSEEPASAAVDLAARAAEHHTHLSAKKQAKADDKAVKEGSAARRRPSSRLQFTDEERADPAMKKYIDRSDKAADKLDKAKAAIPTKKVIRKERTFDETTGKGKTRLRFEEVEKKPNGKLHHSPLSRPMQELRATAHSKIRQVEQDNVGVEAGHKGELLAESAVSYTGSKVRSAIRHHKTKPWRTRQGGTGVYQGKRGVSLQKAPTMIRGWRPQPRFPLYTETAYQAQLREGGTQDRTEHKESSPDRKERGDPREGGGKAGGGICEK